MNEIKIVIPINPTTKKNRQSIIKQGNKTYIIPSKEFQAYQREAGWFITHKDELIDEPLEIECRFYRSTERRVDLTNLLEAIDDILVHYKVIKDDYFKIIKSHDGSRVFIDRANPRTEIVIRSFSGE